MATLAKLSLDGLFLGVERVASIPDNLPPFRVVVPDDCDLQPGEARWDPDARTFRFIDARASLRRRLSPGQYLMADGSTLVVEKR